MGHLEKRREQAKLLRSELRERLAERQGERDELRQEQTETPAQTQLRKARAVYDELVVQLDRVSKLLRENGKDAPAPEVLQRNLDILLQTVLLRTAIGDNDFSHVERQFIREIAQVGDVVDWVNQAYRAQKREDLSWGKLFYMEEQELSELMDFITRQGREMTRDVFLPLVTAEALTQRPWRDVFLEEVEQICDAFAACDGDDDNPEEQLAMHRALEQYLSRPIREAEWDLAHPAE